MPQSRREFLQRTAVAGGVVWAAPIISSVTAAKAGAVSGAPCVCTGVGTGLLGTVTVAGATATLDGGCFAGRLRVPPVTANVLPCVFDSGTCTESVEVADLVVPGLVTAGVVSSSATASTDPEVCTFAGLTIITDLVVLGTRITVGAGINQVTTVSPLRGLLSATVTVNEQTCSGDTLTVNALHILITGPGVSVDLIVARSAATTCATTTTTTRPSTTTTRPSTTTTRPSTTTTTRPSTTTTTTDPGNGATTTTGDPGGGVGGVNEGTTTTTTATTGGPGGDPGVSGSDAGSTSGGPQVKGSDSSRGFAFTGADIAGLVTVAGVSTAAGVAAVRAAKKRAAPPNEEEAAREPGPDASEATAVTDVTEPGEGQPHGGDNDDDDRG